jgi:cytochrome c-type biogenesis protein CcmH/NrfG
VAQRPTPRDGWTAVSHASAEAESARGSPVMKRVPSAAQSTVSFANLPALRADALFTSGSPGERTAAATGTRRVGQGAKPAAGQPAASSTRAGDAARAADATEDVSLQDISFSDGRSAGGVDNTQDVSLSDISVTEMEQARGSARQARATGAAGSEAAELAMRRWRRQSAGIAVGALLAVVGVGWFAVSGARLPKQAFKRGATALVTDAPAPSADRESTPTSAAPALIPVPAGPAPALVGEQLPGAAPTEPAQAAGTLAARATQAPADEAALAGSEQGANAARPAAASAAAPHGGSELEAAREVAAARAGGLVDQAHALQKRRKYAAAKARYREALNLYPDHPRALAGLVQLAIRERDGKQAVALAKQLVRVEPDEVGNLVLLGDAYKSARKRKEAREAWQTAARAGSAAARARLKR